MHKINQLVYASLFLALALALPFLTGQIPQIGAMLTPMHFPVLVMAAEKYISLKL